MPSQEFRTVLNTGVDILEKHGATKWLSDERHMAPLTPEETAWCMTDWFPRSVKVGWKFWALVVPNDIMSQINLTEFVNEYYEKGIRIMVFTDPEQAMEWLERL